MLGIFIFKEAQNKPFTQKHSSYANASRSILHTTQHITLLKIYRCHFLSSNNLSHSILIGILGQLNDHYLRGVIWDPYVIKDAQITSKYSNMSHFDQTTNNIQN